MKLAQFFFRYRSYTPIPLLLIMLYQANPGIPWLIPGLLLILLGESIRFWGVSYAGGETRTTNVGASRLVTDGPFGYVRNPLYTGNMILYAGVVLVAGGPWMWYLLLAAIVFFGIQYSLIISLEEETLHDMFGEAYTEYKEHVPRIIPQFTPWSGSYHSHTRRLSFREALKPEKNTLFNIGMVLFLIALKWFYLAVQ